MYFLGDYITILLDMDAKTLSFGKNGEEPRVAFENIDANELYPCVMFYSTNPGEKVKITDMKVHGTQKDLLPGEPNLGPLHSILTESYIILIRKLHNCVTWTEDINQALLSRLSLIEMFFPTVETHNIDDCLGGLDENIKADMKINELCIHVWPALVVIGGLDRGLRMGGFCKHKATGKKAIVLGILKKGITTVNVQWEQDGGVSDVSISNLDYIEPDPFSTEKMFGLTSSDLLQIARLSGITNEISFPSFELTDEEKILLNGSIKKSSYSGIASNSESRIQSKQVTELPRSVESLTNEMVSNIMGAVRRIRTEKFNVSHSESDVNFAVEKQKISEDKHLETRLLENKMLILEGEHLKLAFLQFAAVKVLGLFVTSPLFKEHYLLNDIKEQNITVSIKTIMMALISKSIGQCKLRNIISLSEIERAQSVLHFMYTKNIVQKEKGPINNRCSAENCTLNNFSNSSLSNSTSGCSRTEMLSTKGHGSGQRLSPHLQSHSSAEDTLGKFVITVLLINDTTDNMICVFLHITFLKCINLLTHSSTLFTTSNLPTYFKLVYF